MLYHATLVVHLISMALWFAYPLSHPRRLRASLDAADAINRESRVVIIAAVATLLSGLGLAALIGFAYVQSRFWAGLGLTVVMQILGGAGIGATQRRIGALVRENKRDDAQRLLKPYAAMAGVHQLLWLVVVVLMTWR